jgi:hypothetical protein
VDKIHAGLFHAISERSEKRLTACGTGFHRNDLSVYVSQAFSFASHVDVVCSDAPSVCSTRGQYGTAKVVQPLFGEACQQSISE